MDDGRKIRVVHVITGLNQGGAEAMLLKLLPGLQLKMDVYVISLIDEGVHGEKIEQMGVPLYCLGMQSKFLLFTVWRLREVLKQIQPDVIQCWMYHGNLAVTIASMLSGLKPIVVWNIRHSLSDLSLEKPMTRQVIRGNRFLSQRPDIIIYNSRVSRKQHEHFGFFPVNGRIIPNGTDLRLFAPSEEIRRRVRCELGIPEDVLVVGHVARLHPMKDHKGFLRAAVSVLIRHPGVHFLLSGRDVSFDNKTLADVVPDGLRNQFHLLGERNDVNELMTLMDVFCLSSAWGEAFPNVLGEAMATEIPCIATDVGDSSIVLGDTGFIVSPKNCEALADKIMFLLKQSKDYRQMLGKKAKQRVVENYSIENITKLYENMYVELIGK